MDTKIYNRKSWHYRLAAVYGTLNENSKTTDICSYIKSVLMGIISCVLLIVVISFVFVATLCPFFYLIVCTTIGSWVMPSDGIILSMAAYILSLIVGGCVGVYKVATSQTVSNSFIGHAYDSIKNKMCFKIQFVGKSE